MLLQRAEDQSKDRRRASIGNGRQLGQEWPIEGATTGDKLLGMQDILIEVLPGYLEYYKRSVGREIRTNLTVGLPPGPCRRSSGGGKVPHRVRTRLGVARSAPAVTCVCLSFRFPYNIVISILLTAIKHTKAHHLNTFERIGAHWNIGSHSAPTQTGQDGTTSALKASRRTSSQLSAVAPSNPHPDSQTFSLCRLTSSIAIPPRPISSTRLTLDCPSKLARDLASETHTNGDSLRTITHQAPISLPLLHQQLIRRHQPKPRPLACPTRHLLLDPRTAPLANPQDKQHIYSNSDKLQCRSASART